MTVAVLDRVGIADVIAALLRADTGTLFGSGKLVQTIESEISKYNAAKVDNHKPIKAYLWVTSESTHSVRARNSDDDYTLGVRIEGHKSSIDTVGDIVDDIWERVKYLINNQMWTGGMFTTYFTDTSAQIINAEPISSELPVPEPNENGNLVVECEGAILVQVNRCI